MLSIENCRSKALYALTIVDMLKVFRIKIKKLKKVLQAYYSIWYTCYIKKERSVCLCLNWI